MTKEKKSNTTENKKTTTARTTPNSARTTKKTSAKGSGDEKKPTKKPAKKPTKQPAKQPAKKPTNTSSTKSVAPSAVATRKTKNASSTATTRAPKSGAKPESKTPPKEKAKPIKFPFEVGDYVFYPNEGLGHIVGTENLMLQGERTPYYIIEFPAQKMINHVPVKNCKKVKLRKVVSKPTAKNIMKVFEVDQKQFELAWKDRLLVYQKINSKGSIVEMAQMLTALFKRKLIKNNLSFQERQVFDFSLESISNELAIVLGKTNEEMQSQIIEQLTETFKDLP